MTTVTEDGYHNPVEEYLETIYALQEEGTVVIAARLAERLGRSAPTVSQMLDRLESDGLVERAGRAVTLTSLGTVQAETVTRRHRLAERLLVDIIGLPWHKAHLEAGRWEHVISADVEARLIAILDQPTTCPHGNPIPGLAGGAIVATTPLASSPAGSLVTIARIGEDLEHHPGALELLEAAGLLPGTEITLVSADQHGVVFTHLDGTSHSLPSGFGDSVYINSGAEG